MNIDDLTIGQIKQIQALGLNNNNESSNIAKNMVGEYVIIRSRNEGLNAGYLVEADNTGCALKDAKRLYRPISKDRSMSWYEGVAMSGLGEKSVVSGSVDKKIIIEDYSITLCSEVAQKSIKGFKPNETTY